jgi:tetratricopeptide (TPR) repeat protein
VARATIDWSYQLLGVEEQTIFARLAVFAGGCTLPALEAVCGHDELLIVLSTLIDNNMLRQEEQSDGEPRFWMLETIRAYALERLEAGGEAEEIRRRHAERFLAVAEQSSLDWHEGDVDWLLLERDHDNFRAALTELVARDDRESVVRLVRGLHGLWIHRGHSREAARWSDEAVRLAAELPPLSKASAWHSATTFAWRRRDLQRAWELGQLALAAYRDAGDAQGEAWSIRQLGVIAQLQGDLDAADALYEQAAAMFLDLGELRFVQVVVVDQGTCALQRGDYAHARALLDENLARSRELGLEAEVGNGFLLLGILALYERRYDDSVPLFVESLESALRHGLRVNVPLSLRGLAASAAVRGDLESAARMSGAAETLHEQTEEEMYPEESSAFAEAMAPVVERADEPEIAAAWAAGGAMSESDAAAYALATVSDQARGQLAVSGESAADR